MKRTLALALLLTFAGASEALAQNTLTAASTACAEGACGAFASFKFASTRKCLRAAASDGLPTLIPFNAMVTVTTTTSPGSWLCWVQGHHNDLSISGSGVIADQAGLPDGNGNCFFLVAGTYRTEPLPRAFGSNAIARRTGVCRLTASPFTANGRPCRITRDCDASHTCDAAADNTSLISGAYLCSQSASTFTVLGSWIR